MTALTRLISIAVACLALAFTAACSDSEPQAPAPSTPPASVAPTPTPTAPVEPPLPEAATQPGKAGAEAFVRHYWEMVNYAQQTGDVTGLKRLSAPACKPCTGGRKGLVDVYADGGRIEGGIFTVIATTARPGTEKFDYMELWETDAHISYSRQLVFRPGSDPVENASGKSQFRFFSRFRDGTWNMTSWMSGELP